MVEKDGFKEIMKKRNGQLAALLESVNGFGSENGNGNGGNGTNGKKRGGNGGK